MFIIARERSTTKTTELIEWLLLGQALPGFPYWSRVIITMHGQREKERLQQLLRDLLPTRGIRVRTALNKAVWTDNEVRNGKCARGIDLDGVEFAVDDVHVLIDNYFAELRKRVDRVTIEGYAL